MSQMHLYVCAFHLAKKDPKLVFEAHHYCMALGEDVHQCVIFDGDGKKAKLLGVEYIISDKLYRRLAAGELSCQGRLVMYAPEAERPGVPPARGDGRAE